MRCRKARARTGLSRSASPGRPRISSCCRPAAKRRPAARRRPASRCSIRDWCRCWRRRSPGLSRSSRMCWRFRTAPMAGQAGAAGRLHDQSGRLGDRQRDRADPPDRPPREPARRAAISSSCRDRRRNWASRCRCRRSSRLQDGGRPALMRTLVPNIGEFFTGDIAAPTAPVRVAADRGRRHRARSIRPPKRNGRARARRRAAARCCRGSSTGTSIPCSANGRRPRTRSAGSAITCMAAPPRWSRPASCTRRASITPTSRPTSSPRSPR